MALSRASALALLGVDAAATRGEVTRAYHRLAREMHPDRSGSPDAAARFSCLSEAYARALHDANEPVPPPAGASTGRGPRTTRATAFLGESSGQRAPIVAGPVSVTPPGQVPR